MLLEVTVKGESAEYDIDVSVGGLTMNDLIVLEKAVGRDTIAEMQDGHVSFAAQKAIIWLKLRDHIPGLKLDTTWDIPLDALIAATAEEDPAPEVEPFEGTTVTGGAGSIQDPNLEAELFAGATPAEPPKV